MDWDGEDRREKHGWRINKEIGAGDLVAISVAVAAVLASYFSLDKRLAIIETASAQTKPMAMASGTGSKVSSSSIMCIAPCVWRR